MIIIKTTLVNSNSFFIWLTFEIFKMPTWIRNVVQHAKTLRPKNSAVMGSIKWGKRRTKTPDGTVTQVGPFSRSMSM